MRGGKILARTRDHSRIRILIEEGLLSEARAATHPDRNKVYSCLGGPFAPEIEFSRKTPLAPGDILLLCTDGLWGEIPGEEMAHILRDAQTLEALPLLLDAAEHKGGARADNLSLVAVRWEESYDDAPSSISTLAMGPGDVTTNIDEFGRDPANKVELSEDEIEAAIAEIRSAIDKYNPHKKES